MYRIIFLLIATFSISFIFAQDTVQYVKYSNSYKFKDGIFFNIEDIKANNPIPLNKVADYQTNTNIAFWDNLLSKKEFEYIDSNGNKQKTTTDKIFAISVKGKLYVNINAELYPLPFLGTLTFFIANIPVLSYDYSPYYTFNYTDFPTATNEAKEFILDFNTGNIYLFNLKNFEELLEKYDAKLYAEFENLSKRKRKKQIFVYLRKFNEKHPLMLVKK